MVVSEYRPFQSCTAQVGLTSYPTVVLGERAWTPGTSHESSSHNSTVLNFVAYTFAPPVLITPLGALSVIVGYVCN